MKGSFDENQWVTKTYIAIIKIILKLFGKEF